MCVICIEFQKQKMSILEATKALGEMFQELSDEHIAEVQDMLLEACAEERERNDT